MSNGSVKRPFLPRPIMGRDLSLLVTGMSILMLAALIVAGFLIEYWPTEDPAAVTGRSEATLEAPTGSQLPKPHVAEANPEKQVDEIVSRISTSPELTRDSYLVSPGR